MIATKGRQILMDWVRRRCPQATLRPEHLGGWFVQGVDPSLESAALRETVALLPDPGWAPILLEGADAADYLHRRLSQSVKSLPLGQGAHALQLDGDGRMMADLLVYRGDDAMMVWVERPHAEPVWELLDRYTLMDRVEVTRFWEGEAAIGLAGPQAPALLAALLDSRPDPVRFAENPWCGYFTVTCAGLPCRIFGDGRFRVPVYYLSVPPMALEQLLGALDAAVRPGGGTLAGRRALDLLRIESGVPRYGLDTDERTIPLEAGLGDAISFDKGCYPGQEVIARMTNLGHPARVMVRLTVDREVDLPSGTALECDGQPAGHLTSSVTWPGLGRTEALGQLKWPWRAAAQTMIQNRPDSMVAQVRPLKSVAG